MKEKNVSSKGKILRKISIFFLNIGKNVCHKIFLHIFPFQNILNLFLFFRKKYLFWLRSGGLGSPPPQFTEWSVTYIFFMPFISQDLRA